MRARAAGKVGLSLTVEPRAEQRGPADFTDLRRARQVAWGALLVSAAAIGGYFVGPRSSGPPSPASQGRPLEIERPAVRQKLRGRD
jgi:hypothetical protein